MFKGDAYEWTLEEPCCGLQMEEGKCRTRAGQAAEDESVWSLPEGDARDIWPGNHAGPMAKRLYPIKIKAPAEAR